MKKTWQKLGLFQQFQQDGKVSHARGYYRKVCHLAETAETALYIFALFWRVCNGRNDRCGINRQQWTAAAMAATAMTASNDRQQHRLSLGVYE